MKRSALVLRSEDARHPFRRSLPPHLFVMVERAESRLTSEGDSDWKLFMLSFITFFTAFYSFIA
jgi:hypothetical protein